MTTQTDALVQGFVRFVGHHERWVGSYKNLVNDMYGVDVEAYAMMPDNQNGFVSLLPVVYPLLEAQDIVVRKYGLSQNKRKRLFLVVRL